MNIAYLTPALQLTILLLFCFCTTFVLPARAVETVSTSTMDIIHKRGQSKPPFLSSGVKANLLLLIDNSGSMLDMAYTDSAATTCFDDSYSSTPTDPYAGYYESDAWYKWHNSSISQWQKLTSYNVGTLVLDAGVIYKASCNDTTLTSCTSSDVSKINDDIGVIWTPATGVVTWLAGTEYNAGTFVNYKGQLYYLNIDVGTKYTSIDIPDKDSKWVAVTHTWRANAAYASGTIVTYNGMVFQAKIDTSAKAAFDWNDWNRRDEGYFEQVDVAAGADGPCGNSPSYSHTYKDSSGTSASDLQVTMVDSTGSKITNATTQTASDVTCFAAKGNFLNWSSSSKFDIEKKILTGGKYYTGYEDSDSTVTTDNDDNRLISENRGCAGTGFVKQVDVTQAAVADPETALTHPLTLRVRGASGDNPWIAQTINDRIDTTDNTTRIEILAVSADGFNNGACVDAADAISTASSGATAKDEISTCMGYDGLSQQGTQNAAFINGLIECTQIWNGTGSADAVNNLSSHCKHLYTVNGVSPIGISPWDPEYLCYGSYNPNLTTIEERAGFFGACWAVTADTSSSCTQIATCSYTEDQHAGNDYYRCSGGVEYKCYGTYHNNDNTCTGDPNWKVMYKDASGNYCENTGSGAWANDPASCTTMAAQKFCDQLKIPEVIDPSDKTTTTTESFNLPAMLIDSGVMGQLDIDRPLLVMKGYIKLAEAPSGVLQEKSNELRIGAMKLNSVGSSYECDNASTTNIDKYCLGQNKDGASLIAPIKLGESTDANGKTHVVNVAEAINDVKANTWTPLAEAVFSALGYFTQRSGMCLNIDGSGNCLDFPISPDDDPVQEWCQPNHLLIITEGASTADINDTVANFALQNGDADSDSDPTSTTSDGTCPGGLQGSTYLDDLTSLGYYFKPSRDQFTSDAAYETEYSKAKIEAEKLYTAAKADINGEIKEGIETHIITTGSLRTVDTTNINSECDPATLMTNAAQEGGTDGGYISGENPSDLKKGLESAISSILERASAGSAASVISSSRNGEGAVYQAIFWPELKRDDGTTKPDGTSNTYTISWTGEVHALLIDSQGYLYEDTNGDGKLNPTKDIDGDGHIDVNEDKDGDSWLDDVNENSTTGDVDCDGNTTDVIEGLIANGGDGDGHLDVAETPWTSTADKGDDRRVVIYYDTDLNKSMGCYKFDYTAAGGDKCIKVLTCKDKVALEDVHYLWSAKDWLARIPSNDDTSLLTNRSTYMSGEHQRYIFTWNDLNNNGIVDSYTTASGSQPEILPFVQTTDWDMSVNAGRGSVANDFGLMSDPDVDLIVNWLRGKDYPGVFRERKLPVSDGNTTMEYWRLGDVINSTPMNVGIPSENYHLLYNDTSYADFAAHYSNKTNKRRSVIYFGANDGMLHAVNAGFYDEEKRMFCRTRACEINSSDSSELNTISTPELGAELWAYVPYNLLPHLEFLADPKYEHKYYVDLRPRIFDAQIFDPADTDHPNGWGTILVGGMRLGGAPVHAEELNGLATDNRVFASSYFVIDITNPEKPPKLLGEITRTSEDKNYDNVLSPGENDNGNASLDANGTDMGYSTSIPSLVIMKNSTGNVGSSDNRWYLFLGSGPHSYYDSQTDPTLYNPGIGNRALKGFSDQNAKIAFLPLQRFFNNDPIRIPDTDPTQSDDDGGRFVLADSPQGFVSDLLTMDFDIAPASADYMADAVYFGTVEAKTDDEKAGFTENADGETMHWDGGGKLYRLRTRNLDADTNSFSYFVQAFQRSLLTSPIQSITTPDKWEPTILMNPDRPISGAPSISYDGYNFWVYFGTGRFFDADDKTDATQQAYYGIKEPMENVTLDGKDIFKFTWEKVESAGTPTDLPGSKGLWPVSRILVHEATNGYNASLACRDDSTGEEDVGGATDCLPTQIVNAAGNAYFDSLDGPSLVKYIAGAGNCTAAEYNNCADGWYKEFYPYLNRERNIGQAAIIGGLTLFTTYQPYDEVCLAEGISNLYGVYYRTGTAWYENIFGQIGLDINGNVKDKIELGHGLSLTPNVHVGSDDDGATTFVQTSTGEIKEVKVDNLPIPNFKTGATSWKEYEK